MRERIAIYSFDGKIKIVIDFEECTTDINALLWDRAFINSQRLYIFTCFMLFFVYYCFLLIPYYKISSFIHS
jgi:hypothetical protein